MRISLLLQREPFGQIIENTLSNYWTKHYQEPISVSWYNKTGAFAQASQSDPWLCNIYLNAIFPNNVKPAAFDPVHREFSRSLIWWRRPIQQIYVQAATHPSIRKYFSQAWMRVSKYIPNADSQLIVPGNHKIRILDHCAKTSISILKDGFDPSFIHSEIETRLVADKLGVPIPYIVEVDDAQRWFVEQYVSGTPVNRLTDTAREDWALALAWDSLQPLYDETLVEESAADYVSSLAKVASNLIIENRLLDAAQRESLLNIVCCCSKEIHNPKADVIGLSLCHGDFQPANILVNENCVWLIDWEYSRRCQIGYDALVYHLQSRHPRGLVERLFGFVAGDIPKWVSTSGSLGSALRWRDSAGRADAALIFLLEELVLHLSENSNPLFYRIGEGLLILERELREVYTRKEYLFA